MSDERDISLCSHCWRIVNTTLRPAGPLGNVLVPIKHRNERGQFCDGTNAEVIQGWDK